MGVEEARQVGRADFSVDETTAEAAKQQDADEDKTKGASSAKASEAAFIKIDVGAPPKVSRATPSASPKNYTMKAPQSPKDPNFKRKRTVRRSPDAGGNGPPGQAGAKAQALRCPRCGQEGFPDVRALGKHAISCKAKGDQKSGSLGNGPGRAALGNDRMAKLMQIKRMQRQHEENEKSKEEQERIEREMQLIIKMERAREERDEALRKKRAAEEKERVAREAAEAKNRAEKAALEKQVLQRAEELMVDSDDSDESDDEAAIARRKRLAEKLAHKKKTKDPGASASPEDQAPDVGASKTPANPGDGSTKSAQAACDAEEDIDWLESPYEGYTAAHMAAYYNDVNHLTKVVELGGDIVTADPEGRTPLHICALYAHNECLELLVTKLASEDLAALDNGGLSATMYAASVGNFSAVAVLADAAPDTLEMADYNGDTPLHFAAYYGFKDVVELLLQLSANPDGPPNIENKSPAAMSTSKDVLELLVSSGADYYGIDNNGRSILFAACASGLVDIAKYLADIDRMDGEELNEDGEEDNQRLLNYADFRGDTPLHAAACNGHAACVELLLDSGAKTDVSNHAGLTAATLAHCMEHKDCMSAFAAHKIEPQDMSQLDQLQDSGAEGRDQVENPDAPEHWQTYTDPDSGCDYFYNPYTGETTWESPFAR